MNFDQAYNYLLSLSNMPRKEYMNTPNTCDWYLKRTQYFLDMIGNPEKKIPHYIHVTGTSGKGSVTSFLHSILQASGKKVGSTYSPHPSCITERWRVGNKEMTKKEFADIVTELKPAFDKYIATTPYDMLSFFEITEVIGFIYFSRKKVDWVVLEVACGGRYDSSNIIPHKDVAVITNIGLDHVGIIGNNKEEIAYEKAGIISKGCDVFTTEKNKKILDIIEKEADTQKAHLHKILRPKYKVLNELLNKTVFSYQDDEYTLNINGAHQVTNAILCIEIAQHLGIKTMAIKKGISSAYQPLRMEIVSDRPLIILDGAHNVDKIKSTVGAITPLLKTKKDLHLIVGFSGNKQVNPMMKNLLSLKPKTVAITRSSTNHMRTVADPQDLEKYIKKLAPKTKTSIFLDPQDAYAWSKAQQKTSDVLLATGSIYMSGELRN